MSAALNSFTVVPSDRPATAGTGSKSEFRLKSTPPEIDSVAAKELPAINIAPAVAEISLKIFITPSHKVNSRSAESFRHTCLPDICFAATREVKQGLIDLKSAFAHVLGDLRMH